jgi:hypothetical protein
MFCSQTRAKSRDDMLLPSVSATLKANAVSSSSSLEISWWSVHCAGQQRQPYCNWVTTLGQCIQALNCMSSDLFGLLFCELRTVWNVPHFCHFQQFVFFCLYIYVCMYILFSARSVYLLNTDLPAKFSICLILQSHMMILMKVTPVFSTHICHCTFCIV